MSGDTLEHRLRALRDRIRIPLADATLAMLDALIAMGRDRATAEDPIGARDDEAVEHFRRLTDDLVQQARILRLDVLAPATLVGALERLCPLWPFCLRP